MTMNTEWPAIVRVVWMAGGVVAVNNPGREVHITAGFDGIALCTAHIPAYPSLFEVIRGLHIPIVGTTFILDREEALRLRRPQFRAFSGNNRGWLVEDTHQQWRQIAHASGQRDEMDLMDVAARIASGLSYSEMRLEDLVQAYSVQLRGLLDRKPFQDYQRFKDTNSGAVYKAIHALFWEMAVLRDVLAEFAAKFCFSRTGITSLGGLDKSLRAKASPDPLAAELLEATDRSRNGWLAVFTAYRNLFTHSAPMEQVAGSAFAVQDTRAVTAEKSIPQIYYPLPSNAAKLSQQRSSGPLFKTFEELLAASSGKRHERQSEPDALEYLSTCLDRLAQLSKLLCGRSPVKPQPIEITSSDIIGELRVSARG